MKIVGTREELELFLQIAKRGMLDKAVGVLWLYDDPIDNTCVTILGKDVDLVIEDDCAT